ncbi:MAG: S-layer homology domain-containing protein, partial [Actinomycetota bacterium]
MRILALATATLALGALLTIVPRPAFAVERAARVDSEVPELTSVAAEARPSPESAPLDDGEGAESGEPVGEPGTATAAEPVDRLTASATDVDDFEMIGVGLETDHTEDAQIRIRIDGAWEPWQPLTNLEGDHGPEPGTAEAEQARPASDPIWVGDGDGYELDLPGDATDVEVHLVRETEERVVIDATDEAGAAYPMPSVLSRGSWGARNPSGSIGVASTVDKAVIHHTVNSNSYSSASVPGMIRSIQAYHMDAQGWFDIGYNFVVDRFGRTWEGRDKSTFDAVVGAHAQGSNTGSTGVAWLGDGSGAGLTSSGHDAISRLIAWKLPLHGTFFTGSEIVGHRDVFPTSCPGNAIHSQLGSIRTSAVSLRPPAGPFLDVPNTAWNAGEILWGKYIGLATGYPDGNFLPGDALSRAQFVNMLWNLVGKPTASTEHGFTDVPRSSWLTSALDWAAENGIMTGYPDGTFRGDDTMSRSTIAVVLWRWATSPVVVTPHGFTDIAPGSWPDD